MKFRENSRYEQMDRDVEQLQRKIRLRAVSESDRIRMREIVEDTGYRKYIKRRTQAYNQQVRQYGQIVFDL
jgi:hypothetical protein